MSEQTRQQIAGELEYAMGQCRVVIKFGLGEGSRDAARRALDGLERIQSYLARADAVNEIVAIYRRVQDGTTRGAGGVWTAASPPRLDKVMVPVDLLERLARSIGG